MRNVDDNYLNATSEKGMAEIAAEYARVSMDSYSEYGVGAALLVEVAPEWTHHSMVYAGTNINLSGMEVKIHAEQMALFQALMDLKHASPTDDFSDVYSEDGDADNTPEDFWGNVTLSKMVVVTTENDGALKCGHCLQVLSGACEFLNSDPEDLQYIAARGQATYDGRGNPDGVHYDYDRYTLQELIGDTYVTTRQ